MDGTPKQSLCDWVGREFNMAGVLAAGGADADRPPFAAFVSGELVLAHDAEVWECIGDSIAALGKSGAPVGQLLWGFEQAVLCTVQRDDGAWIAVFTVPDLGDEPALALHAKLDAFRQQPSIAAQPQN